MNRIGVTIHYGAAQNSVDLMSRDGQSVAKSNDLNTMSRSQRGNLVSQVVNEFARQNPDRLAASRHCRHDFES